MSYTVNNGQVFAAAFGGALSAFGASAPQGSISQASYVQQCNAALAVAEAVDTAWGANSNNAMDFSAVGVATGLVLRDRGVFPITPVFSSVSNWTLEARAVVAMVLSGDSVASGAGISFPNLANSGGSAPAPGTPSYNPTWYALTDIYLDPVHGNDTASGTIGNPVKTMAQVVQRYGSSSPQIPYGQNLTIHQLSAQTIGIDSFFFNPEVSGGGSFAWTATPTAIGAPFSPSSVTAAVKTASGNMLTLNFATLPPGIAIGQTITNITLGSYSCILAIIGLAITVAQPISGFSEDNSWGAGNSYQLSASLLANWENPMPQIGDEGSGLAGGTFQVTGVTFPDTTGLGYNSTLVAPQGGSTTFLNCLFQGSPVINGQHTAFVNHCYLENCCFTGVIAYFDSCTILGGGLIGGGFARMSIIDLGFYIPVGHSFPILACTIGELAIFGIGYITGIGVVGAGFSILTPTFASALIWGTGNLDTTSGSGLMNTSGSSFASTLKIALLIDGVTTASSFNSSAANNPFTAGITITAANLDTGGGAGNPGLQNPRTGSKICSS